LHYDADDSTVARCAAHAEIPERRRQGDVMVSLEVGPNMTADLAGLGWLPAPDRADKDALAHALIELIERAIGVRVPRRRARRARSASCSKSSAARSTRWSSFVGSEPIRGTTSPQL
jgi:hypothetical protein